MGSFRFSTCDVNLNFNLSSPINQTQKLITQHYNVTMGSAEDRPAPLRLGTVAPDFEAETTAGPIKFHDFIGDKWVVLFSHPEDYTPVCTTELGAFAKLEPEFTKRNVKLIGLSANTVESHGGWVRTSTRSRAVSCDSRSSATRRGRLLLPTTCWTTRMPPTSTRRALLSPSAPSSSSTPRRPSARSSPTLLRLAATPPRCCALWTHSRLVTSTESPLPSTGSQVTT